MAYCKFVQGIGLFILPKYAVCSIAAGEWLKVKEYELLRRKALQTLWVRYAAAH